MSSRRQNDTDGIDDIFSYMCSLAVAKYAKKSEKKKASCGGPAMRKRLLIKNFVTQMLDQERQMSQTGREQLSREVKIPGRRFHHSPLTQTHISDEDEMQEEEVSTDDIDEGVDDEYQLIDDNTQDTQQMPDYSEDTVEVEAEDEEDLDDSLNNNSKHIDEPSKLPAISTLDRYHPPFVSHSYLVGDGVLEGSEDDPSELSDELAPETFELFSSKSLVITSTTSVEVLKQTAPPSWHQTEPDLFIMERSIPSLYYDDYTTIQTTTPSVDAFGMTYRPDDFTSIHPTTTLASPHIDSYTSPFMISSASQDNNHQLSIVASNRQSVPQLPENFMDESVITSTTSSLNTYAELHATHATGIMTMPQASKAFSYPNSFNEDEDLETKAEIDLCSVEDKAQGKRVEKEDVENEDCELSDDETEDVPQLIVKSAFVDLINMVPQPVKLHVRGGCHKEAFNDNCFVRSRHITDLDTQLTLIEKEDFSADQELTPHHLLMMSDTKLSAAIVDYDSPSFSELIGSDTYGTQSPKIQSPKAFAGKSPRKRLNQLDYGSLISSLALSPKRIKL